VVGRTTSFSGLWSQDLPATGGRVDGKGLALGVNRAVGVLEDVFGEEDGIVLPLRMLVDPEAPALVGD